MADTLEKVIDQTFTISEAASALGIGFWSVKAALENGRLSCYRFNDAGRGKAGRTLIGLRHLREFQERSECKAQAASK